MNEKPSGDLPQLPTTQAEGRQFAKSTPSSRVYPGPAGGLLTGFYSRIIERFCERNDLPADLYEPDRLAARLPEGASIDRALTRGWLVVTDEWTEEMVRKRPLYNRSTMRHLCVYLKVPYWDKMPVSVMKAVVVRWAIADEVPETKF